MRCKYLDQDYEQRMNGGIAFYDGKPVLITATRGIIHIQKFPEGDLIKDIKKDDPLLDLSSPALGYVNYKNACFYVYRKPERKYKQTLTSGAIGIFNPSSTKPDDSVRMEHLFMSTEFKAMLEGKYPKLADVMSGLNSGIKIKGRAIDRDVAIARDSYGIVRVYYKFDEVGYINPGETVVRVPHTELAWVVSRYLKEYGWEVD